MSRFQARSGHHPGALCCLFASLIVGCSQGRSPDDGWSQEGYSPLDAINESNVEPLSVAWEYDAEADFTAPPVVMDGVVYADADGLGVHAVSADTGHKIWHFDAKVPESAREPSGEIAGHGAERWSRGVALSKGRVYVTARDGRLIALDAVKGVPIWESETCPSCSDGARDITSAPRVAGEHIVVATAGIEGAASHLTAFAAATGEVAWRFMEPAEAAGEGNSWGGMAFDPSLRVLYVSSIGERPTIRRFDPQTGRVAWEYQLPRAESHPGDTGVHLALAELTIDGAQRQVVMQAHSDGQFYVLDRTDGKPISVARYAEASGTYLADSLNFSQKVGLAYLPVEANGTRYLQSWNPASAKEQWRIVLEDSTPCGGILSTAGNLLIQGDSEGYLNVYESEWGEVRTRVEINACPMGAPFSYSVKGVQYIGTVLPSAAEGKRGGRILALKLGGREVKESREMKRFPKTIRPEQASS